MSEEKSKIKRYQQEHPDTTNTQYLVRGALLRCNFGTHARRVNLPVCHGVYIDMHPVIHEGDFSAGEGRNIPHFGICKCPTPPPTEIVDYTKDVPRLETGEKSTQDPGGFETGHRCQPEFDSGWQESYSGTQIQDGSPKNCLTTQSFLFCIYGGCISAQCSGQNYTPDEEEVQYYEHDEGIENESGR